MRMMRKSEGKRSRGRPRHRWFILKWILNEQGAAMWTGLIWLRIGTSDGLL
jgi:hypothetical protein